MKRRHLCGAASIFRDLSGGMSVFFAAILSSILVFALVLHQVEALRIFQAEAEQAMSAQLGANLANYDRALHQRFGLWGVAEDEMQTEVFDRLMEQAIRRPLLPHSSGQAGVQVGHPLEEGAIACRQIVDFMRIRAPLSWLEEYRERVQMSRSGMSQELQHYKGKVEEATETWKEHQSFLTTLREAEIPEEFQGVWAEFQSHLAWEQELGGSGQGMQQLFEGLGQAEAWLQPGAIPGMEGLLVDSYILDFFPCATTGKAGEDVTWRGGARSANGGADAYCVERILTGMESGLKAHRLVQVVILGIRTVQHMADYYTHPEKRSKYRALATALSLLIATVSLGSIWIPPAVLEGLLIFLRCVYLAYQDVRTLDQGGSVSFQPGSLDEPRLLYRDFLRVFLLPIPKEQLASRAVAQIQQCLGKTFFTEVQLEATFQCGLWNSGRVQRKEAFSIGQLQDGQGS